MEKFPVSPVGPMVTEVSLKSRVMLRPSTGDPSLSTTVKINGGFAEADYKVRTALRKKQYIRFLLNVVTSAT